VLELAHAPPALLVETRVFDRACHERRARNEELDLVLRELARRLGVHRDDADHGAVLAEDRDRDKRLEPLLIELRHVLHAGVGEKVVADEGGLLLLRHPPGEPFAPFEGDAADVLAVRLARRTQDQPVTALVDEVDTAGVNGAGVGEQADDGLEDFVQIE
jgi:hypothetical protein